MTVEMLHQSSVLFRHADSFHKSRIALQKPESFQSASWRLICVNRGADPCRDRKPHRPRDGIRMPPAHVRLEKVTRRWLDLAERRLAYHEELYRSGRWRHYFPTEAHFARRMLDVIKVTKAFQRLLREPAVEERLRRAA
jgi:hypothetical protein